MAVVTRLVLKHPRPVLGALLAVTLVFAAFLPRLHISSDLRSMVPRDDPALRALDAVTDEFGSQDLVMVVLRAPDVYTVSTLQKVGRLAEALREIPGVDTVTSPLDVELVRATEAGMEIQPVVTAPPSTPDEVAQFKARFLTSPLADSLISPDGRALAIVVTLEPGFAFNDEFSRTTGPQIEALVARQQGPESIDVVGEPFLAYVGTRSIRRDLEVLFPLAVAVVLGSFYVSFRTAAALVLPMVPVLLSLVWTLGLMAALGYHLSIVSSVLPVMLVVVGSASTIYVLGRYQEGRREGLQHPEAVERAMMALNAPLVMVSLTDAVGFASLATSFVQPVKEFGLFTALGILFSLLATLVAIPAILSLRELRAAAQPRPADPAGAWGTFDRWMAQLASAMARPAGVGIVGLSSLLLVVAALGIPRVRIETNFLEYFRPDSPVVRGTRAVEQHFGGTNPLTIVVDTGTPDGVKDPAVLKRLERLQQTLDALPDVGHSQSVVDVVREVNRALNGDEPAALRVPDSRQAVAQELLLFALQGGSGLDQLVNYDYSKALLFTRIATVPTQQIKRIVHEVEVQSQSAFAGTPARVSVVGIPQLVIRLLDRFIPSLLQSLAISFVVVGIIVGLLMRSWLVGLLSLVPLVLTVVLQFGLMGYGGIALDVATTMIASITIGVGVDFGIQMMSRFRQERTAGRPPVEALAVTAASTGRAILTNALSLAAGFAVLVFSDFRAVAVLGALLAMTMLVSAAATLFPLAALLVRMPERTVAGGWVTARAASAQPGKSS
ncbi:MAG: RND family transporter [Limnochordaceae bacterium]|nr:RND family transporter [Limnochordaceae bacterium]